MYPLFRANRIGPYTRFINFSHAVRQEQTLLRISSTTRYKGLTAQHSSHHVRSVTNIPGDAGSRLRMISLYERIKGTEENTSHCGSPSKAHDIEGKRKGEKSRSEAKWKASKSSWARKQKAESAAFNKALDRGRELECYHLRSQWIISWGPDKKTEQICHSCLLMKPGVPAVLWNHERSHDLDECMYHDENGRIQCFSEDGQVFYEQIWAKTRESDFGESWYLSELEQLSGDIMETTRRETK